MTRRARERWNQRVLAGASAQHTAAIERHAMWEGEVEKLSLIVDTGGGSIADEVALASARDAFAEAAVRARIAEDWMMRCQGLVDEAMELAR